MTEPITPAQADVLTLRAAGLGAAAIAARLGISRRTVYQHQCDVYQRLGIDAECPGPVAVRRWMRGEVRVMDGRWQ